jgi:nicotinamidase-related amidase
MRSFCQKTRRTERDTLAREFGAGEDAPTRSDYSEHAMAIQEKRTRFGAGIAADAALLIIDMINPFDFAGANTLMAPALRAARNIRALRDRFDRIGAPVIYVNDNFMHWQGEFRDLIASCLAPGAPGAAIADLLQPGPTHYHVLKPKHSGFHDTPLEILLEKLQIKRVVLTGIATDACVLASAQDAHMREFALWIPSDCTAAQTPQRKRRALALMQESYRARMTPAVGRR